MNSGGGEIIKSFLVGLGFDVDESSLSVFNKSIQTAALRVTGLYGAISAFAGSMVFAFAKISEGFEEMGYQYHIIAPQINKAIVLRNEMLKAYGAAGISIRKVIVDSLRLNMSLAKTKFAMEAIYKSVASKFFGVLEKQSDAFRKRLYQNMPYIISILEKFVKILFKAFEIVTQLGMRVWSILSRVYEFFKDLDQATGGWSTKILAVVAAWRFLNLAFLATPLGALITGLIALLALYDDFKTFREGGKSFFNWSAVIPIIDNLAEAFGHVYNVVKDLFSLFTFGFNDRVGQQLKILIHLADELGAAFTNIANATIAASDAVDSLVRHLSGKDGIFSGLLNSRDNADQWLSSKFSNLFGGSGQLGANGANNATTTINANMQTAVNVSGSPNAQATGGAVAASQGAVNRDFVRNLKGTTR
jgi:hypothetical protein